MNPILNEDLNMSVELYVGDAKIKTNSEGMFCLNDLHEASGSESRHRPNHWIEKGSTKCLISEILKAGKPAIKKTAGRYGGTYVCKEMVYSYAMWISPAFQLKVIKAYDEMRSGVRSAEALVNDVRLQGRGISARIDQTTKNLQELKKHGTNWGSYGASIRKAKKEVVKELEALKEEVQLKLDYIQ